MHLSSRFLAHCKASISTYAKMTIMCAKQEVKRHDLHGVKLVMKALVAMLLLMSVLSSISTNSPMFYMSFELGPRQKTGSSTGSRRLNCIHCSIDAYVNTEDTALSKSCLKAEQTRIRAGRANTQGRRNSFAATCTIPYYIPNTL